MTRRFLDLFCGAGGFSQGLKDAGFEHLLGIELDRAAAETYAANHGSVLVADIKKVSLDKIRDLGPEFRKKIDLVAASPPCQSFSLAGPRKVGDPKDMLYKHVIRLVDEIKPRWVLIENVPGMLSKQLKKKAAVDLIIGDLERIGYHAEYRTLIGTDYEIPQIRKRVIIVASKRERDVKFPEPVVDFDPSIRRFLEPRRRVPERNFWAPHVREYFVRKHEYVKYLDLDKPSPTIRACYLKNRGADGAVMYDEDHIRRLTEKEVAAIQTFPKSYVFVGSMTEVYKQIGNAIPPKLAEHLGRALLGL